MKKFNLYINGKIVAPQHGAYFDSVNPSNASVFARVADGSHEDMQQAIQAARTAFDDGRWSGMDVRGRGEFLTRVSQSVRKHAKELADLEIMDVGKTSKQATFIDVPTCAETFEYFGSLKDPLAGEINPVSAPVRSLTVREPMGVVGCLIPWNYPLIMFAWKVAPALLAGNTVVFRPSSTASASVMRLAQIIAEEGLPAGVLNIVSSSRHEVASELILSPLVDMISFTGGTQTGQQVMAMAALTTKKLTLELGGKSPNIVFADCDVEAALGGTMASIFMNQGQMCTAASRLFVEDKIYDHFVKQLVEKTKQLKIGPSTEYDTDFGPVVSDKQRASILAYIQKGIDQGAELLCGGKIPDAAGLENGFYLEPTIFVNVTNDMAIACEEIFGPVLVVQKFSDVTDVINSANDSIFGLAACVWTKDQKKAQQVSESLRCGTVWVNTYGGFYNEAPIGGFKRSGFGRELGRDGLLEYTQTKHVCFDETPGGKPLVSSWF